MVLDVQEGAAIWFNELAADDMKEDSGSLVSMVLGVGLCIVQEYDNDREMKI
jgi:hypothetical protein